MQENPLSSLCLILTRYMLNLGSCQSQQPTLRSLSGATHNQVILRSGPVPLTKHISGFLT